MTQIELKHNPIITKGSPPQTNRQMKMSGSLPLLLGALMSLTTLACTIDDGATLEEELAVQEKELLGELEFGDECTETEKNLLERSMRYGRTVATTDAFEECVDKAIRVGYYGIGPYRECEGAHDPFYGESIDRQIDKVLEVTRTTSNVRMACATGTSGNASAAIGSYGTESEHFGWSKWWFRDKVAAKLFKPLCSDNGNQQPCRFAAAPWPYSQIAGTAWHEVMHRHGYKHASKATCGYDSSDSPSYDFQHNTMPYIIGQCIERTIKRSAQVCGDIETCGANELKIVDGINDSTCSCVHDPRMEGIGVMNVSGDEFSSQEQVATDESMGGWGQKWVPGWSLDTDDKILAFGDFDGDGEDEYLIKGSWGMGLIGTGSDGRMYMQKSIRYQKWIGSWLFRNVDTVEGVGDFNGDGKDDFIIRSNWGIGIVGFNNYGNFVLYSIKKHNHYLGSYYLRSSDTIAGVGDFDGDGKADMFIQNSFGTFGVIYLYGDRMYSKNTWKPGQRIGSWHHRNIDKIASIGDFDGDGKTEFIVRSNWGIGVIERTSYGALHLMDIHRYGSSPSVLWNGRSPWKLNANDDFAAVADLNGDGKKDIVLQSASGIGVLSLDANGKLRTRTKYKNRTRLAGGWLLRKGDKIAAVGNFDGYRGEDLLVRSSWGTGLLSFNWYNYTFVALAIKQHDDLMDSWLHSSEDVIYGSGDLDGDGTDEFILQR